MADNSFQAALDFIRAKADSEREKGTLFERLMKAFFQKDRLYQERFVNIQTWFEWAVERGLDGNDNGVDLVAEEADGSGYCAIQCKCYAPDHPIAKKDIDAFLAASSRKEFVSRILVATGKELNANVQRQLKKTYPPCQEIYASDLEKCAVDWPNLADGDAPDDLKLKAPFQVRPHQQEAMNAVLKGFETSDRGQMIMACGTGKTFAALRIAEQVAGKGGRVLYLVPSIALFGQAMREWAEQRELEHGYIGVCSDVRAGHTDEDAQLKELEMPVTTDLEKIVSKLQFSEDSKRKMTVVFSTYHSLPLIERAQQQGAPPFDLILCDEAHRTTGVERGDKTSHFNLVHSNKRIQAHHRLYMTATPRLYTEAAKTRAADHRIDIYSMDNEDVYGPEFHRLSFSEAVKRNLLSDYKVVLFAVTEAPDDEDGGTYITREDGSDINITDATKIVGCWKALHNPEHAEPGNEKRLQRAIVFANTIENSKAFRDHFQPVVERAMEMKQEREIELNANAMDAQPQGFICETAHVDGKDHALIRKRSIDWLKREQNGEIEANENGGCRILSNARCLSEGVDVPALDAVIFLEPKRSIIDIVQAVGRVMRKFEGKQEGYIILPVACPANADPANVLDDNKRFGVVWDVLKALRAHDDRLSAEINKIDLNEKPPERFILPPNFIQEEKDPYGDDQEEVSVNLRLFSPFNIAPDKIYAKMVEKCGDRKYWEKWAVDVADIFKRTTERIEGMLSQSGTAELKDKFSEFHNELRSSINDSINEENTRDMLAQHIVMKPVFEAIFKEYDFANRNPVAKALESLRRTFSEYGLEDETKSLARFYESVSDRIKDLDNSEGRQTVLKELYEKFFQTAFKKDSDRLGIVYTPVEIIDFILHSADDILQSEFGRTLSSEGVHILDPFAGAGLFLTRLLQSDLIKNSDLERKFQQELFANEILLLAYYIAAINIEEAYRGRQEKIKEGAKYEPFNGIVLTDTFNQTPDGKTEPPAPKASEGNGQLGNEQTWLLKDNQDRIDNLKEKDLTVIVGNPPWSAGQKNAADNNPNTVYPTMAQRIRETYSARSIVSNRKSLYDSYKMAFRWASDRIQDRGIAAFVTNGSWIEGNADSGVRACFVDEFSTIYVLNLRGDLRTSGERMKKEGGNIFGNIRTGPAITLLVKNPDAKHKGCRIRYYALDDYRKTDEKREDLNDKKSINGIDGWRDIKPNRFHEWVNQRSEAFQKMYPVGTKETKAGKADDAIFQLYSQGFQTGKDVYLYNFSYEKCAENARLMIDSYRSALRELEYVEKPSKEEAEAAAQNHTSNIRWDGTLKANLKRKKEVVYKESQIRKAHYRPFVKINSYADSTIAVGQFQNGRIFPDPSSKNRAICVTGLGSKIPFSAVMTDTLPDLSLIDKSQCFPRYRYGTPHEVRKRDASPQKLDNISDSALSRFQDSYSDSSISKDDIFDYVYGVLHSPVYRERFANDLSKELPRIPFAPDFWSFASAGMLLAELHLGYETCAEYPLRVDLHRRDLTDTAELQASDCRVVKMKFADKETKEALIVNDRLTLSGIPPAAFHYVVNGRSPLEWLINRYQVKTDKLSGIVNDPNAWFANDPTGLVSAIKRAVYVSVESARIIDDLPPIE